MVDTAEATKKWNYTFRELAKEARKCIKCKKIFDPEKNIGSWECVQLYEFSKDGITYAGLIRADHSGVKEAFTDADDIIIPIEFVKQNITTYFANTKYYVRLNNVEQQNGFSFYHNVAIQRYDKPTAEKLMDEMPYLTSDVEIRVGERYTVYGNKIPLYIDVS